MAIVTDTERASGARPLPLDEPIRPDSILLQAAEALLFAAGAPMAVARLARLLDVRMATVEAILADLSKGLAERGVRLTRHADEVQLTTAPHLASLVSRLWETGGRGRLSAAARETL